MIPRLPAHPLRRTSRFIATTARQFLKDDCQSTAAALTYQTLFAVVPLLTVMYSVLNSVKAFAGVGARIQEFLEYGFHYLFIVLLETG